MNGVSKIDEPANLQVEDFYIVVQEILSTAQKQGATEIAVNSGNVHRQVGGYPGSNHRMPMCCSAMRSVMREGDEIIQSPPSGYGARLTIRYRLPR